jgi:hypothetical protein
MFTLIGETEAFVGIQLVNVEYIASNDKLMFTFVDKCTEKVHYSINKLTMADEYLSDALVCVMKTINRIPEGEIIKGSELRKKILDSLKEESYCF